MERRTFVVGVGAAIAAPLAAEAQRAAQVAFLCATNCSSLPNTISPWDLAFLAGLKQVGYALGTNTSVDMTGVGVGYERLPGAAKRLVQRKAAVIIAFGNEATWAAKQATESTPIVMVNVADAADEGLVNSLRRPGANITGVSVPLGVLAAKHVELLKEINPRLQRVGVLWHPALELNQARFERLQRAVESLGVLLIPVRATTYRDLEKIFVSLGDGRPDGLLLMEQLIGTLRAEIAQFALEHHLATAASDRVFAHGGGLLAYGPSILHLYERAGIYAGNVLKGTRPRELPVEEPTRFELIVNRSTATALGVTLPPSVLLRADEVIE